MREKRGRDAGALTAVKMRTYTPRVTGFPGKRTREFQAPNAILSCSFDDIAGRIRHGVCFFACGQCLGAEASEISGGRDLATRIAEQLDHGAGGWYGGGSARSHLGFA